MRTCGFCGHSIANTERTIQTYRGAACEICADKIDGLTPSDEDDNCYTDIEEET